MLMKHIDWPQDTVIVFCFREARPWKPDHNRCPHLIGQLPHFSWHALRGGGRIRERYSYSSNRKRGIAHVHSAVLSAFKPFVPLAECS